MEQYLNPEDALRRLGGNKTVYVSLLRKFLASDSLAPLKAAFEADNPDDAQAAAHTLKGLSANLSMNALCDAAQKLETALKNHTDFAALRDVVYDVWKKTTMAVNEYIYQ